MRRIALNKLWIVIRGYGDTRIAHHQANQSKQGGCRIEIELVISLMNAKIQGRTSSLQPRPEGAAFPHAPKRIPATVEALFFSPVEQKVGI